jgi:hypothetical protein
MKNIQFLLKMVIKIINLKFVLKKLGLNLNEKYDLNLTLEQKRLFNIIFQNIILSILNLKETEQKEVYLLNHKYLIEILKFLVKIYPTVLPSLKTHLINLNEIQQKCKDPATFQRVFKSLDKTEIEVYELFEKIAYLNPCTINQFLLMFVNYEKGFTPIKNEQNSISYIPNSHLEYLARLKSLDNYFAKNQGIFESISNFQKFFQNVSLALILLDEKEDIFEKNLITNEIILLKRILKNTSELFSNIDDISQLSHFLVNSRIFIFFKKIYKRIITLQIKLRSSLGGVQENLNLKERLRHHYSILFHQFGTDPIDISKYENEGALNELKIIELIQENEEKVIENSDSKDPEFIYFSEQSLFKENLPNNYDEYDLNGRFRNIAKFNFDKEIFSDKISHVSPQIIENRYFYDGINASSSSGRFTFSKPPKSNENDQNERYFLILILNLKENK